MTSGSRSTPSVPPAAAAPLRNLVELLPAAIYTCDAPSGRISFYNAEAARLWGRTPEIGDTDARFCGSFRLWRPDGSRLPHDETPMAHAVRHGRPARNEEVVIERPDGSQVTVLVNIDPIRDETGQITGAVNVFYDTTSLAEVDAARARLVAIVESSQDAIVGKNLDGVITSWNQGAERLFGYTAGEAIGQLVSMLIPPDRADEEPDILRRVGRGEWIAHYETVRVRKDGRLVDISLTVSPMRDRFGRVIGASKIARDITDRKDAEARAALERRQHEAQREALLAAAERARKDAEAANRGKDEFLAMLGHELRNPLAAVRNAVAAASLDEANRDRALAIARRQTDQLGRIVDDLLDVARITLGRVRLRKTRVRLADVLQRTVDGALVLMDDRGHSLTLSVPDEPIWLDADAARIEQAVANLLTNAAKYTDPGGRVTLSAAQRDGQAIITVSDNGMGIAAESLARIFDLFAQGDRPLDRHQGGLGIGLTLVRRIVELHGGDVRARSAGVGGGSEFVIQLPALSADADRVGQIPAPDGQSATPVSRQVLLVEDNPDAAETLQMLLELLGHQVRVAGDGQAALASAGAIRPDIMLVDIGLPGMNGYEVARRVRGDARLAQVVLVALTGYGRPEDKAEALSAGFDRHLVKPVDFDTLRDLIGRLGAPPDGAEPTSDAGAIG